MRTHKKQIKKTALLLVFAMLVQSCTVYKSTPVSLDQDVKSDTKVKVLTSANKELIYKRIKVENGNHYGVKRVKSEMVNISLDSVEIKNIRVKNKKVSTILNVGIPVFAIGLVGIISSSGGVYAL